MSVLNLTTFVFYIPCFSFFGFFIGFRFLDFPISLAYGFFILHNVWKLKLFVLLLQHETKRV